MHCVYIIQSLHYSDQIYVGCTGNWDKRLSNHNSGTTPHTEKYKPWELIVYFAFKDKNKAITFEKYLYTLFIQFEQRLRMAGQFLYVIFFPSFFSLLNKYL